MGAEALDMLARAGVGFMCFGLYWVVAWFLPCHFTPFKPETISEKLACVAIAHAIYAFSAWWIWSLEHLGLTT